MNISDLTTVTELVEKRQGIIALAAMIEAGEDITLTVGEIEVPVQRPELVAAARYQLKVHFEAELELIENALTALNVDLDTGSDSP